MSWYGPLAWLRLRIRLSQSSIAGLSKVVVLVVLCGQISKTVEICPYRQILKVSASHHIKKRQKY